MAVTKIRKVSSWTLLGLLVVSLVACLTFFFGGSEVDPSGNKEYLQTGLLLGWVYVLIGAVIVATVCFTLLGFFNSFKVNRKKALTNLFMIVALGVILLVTYAIGDATELPFIGEDSQKYNTAGWLKVIDMCLFTIYTLGGLTLAAIVWSSVSKFFKK